jgi:hypothetical protein
MEKSPWEANSGPAGQCIPHFCMESRRSFPYSQYPSRYIVFWISLIEFTPINPIYMSSLLILTIYLWCGRPIDLFCSGFITKLCELLLSFVGATCPHLIRPDFITLSTWRRLQIMKVPKMVYIPSSCLVAAFKVAALRFQSLWVWILADIRTVLVEGI